MSLFANFAQLSLLVVMVGLAAISGMVMARSVQEEDAVAAWIWVVVFGATSLVAAWSFWRLV
jgi:uncharacterized membrane protein HdeD (DUF308 family)